MKKAFGNVLPAVIVTALVCISMHAEADGCMPDPEESQKALHDAMEDKCKKFKKFGVDISAEKLAYDEGEMIDSFLNGREFYRSSYNEHLPLEGKLDRLRQLLGEAYPGLERKWKLAVSARNAGKIPRWTPESFAARLKELEMMTPDRVIMDDGRCRSCSSTIHIDSKCPHCGRHTVYTRINDTYHDQPPSYYDAVAKELRRWGLDVHIDARRACPDCCMEKIDFKLSTTPTLCRLKPSASVEGENRLVRFIKPEWDLHVRNVLNVSKGLTYEIICVFPTAWARKGKYGYEVFATPSWDGFLGYRQSNQLIFAESPEVRNGRFIKVMDFRFEGIDIGADKVDVVERTRSSGLDDIPETMFIVFGRRFPVSELMADTLLSFVQGYTTVITGPFHDHLPIQKMLPFLKNLILGE